jgi:beta-phosphoglucomutase-like phosphatase (HAD superfamily)
VASSSHQNWVRGNLRQAGLLDRVDVLAGGDEVAAHKPDPAVYLLALRRLGITADEALAFEDTPHGLAAARAAGLRCVAVPNAYTPAGRFTGAEVVLPSASAASLEQLLGRTGS